MLDDGAGESGDEEESSGSILSLPGDLFVRGSQTVAPSFDSGSVVEPDGKTELSSCTITD